MWLSWSVHFSTIALMLGGLEQYNGTLTAWVGMKNAGAIIMIGALIGIALRAKTNNSLEEKGK